MSSARRPARDGLPVEIVVEHVLVGHHPQRAQPVGADGAGLTWVLSRRLPLGAVLSAARPTTYFTLSRPGGTANAPTAARLAEYARGPSPPEGYDLSFLDLLDSTIAP